MSICHILNVAMLHQELQHKRYTMNPFPSCRIVNFGRPILGLQREARESIAVTYELMLLNLCPNPYRNH